MWGVSRKPRIQYPGAMYHVTHRGDQREDVFRDDQHRASFWGSIARRNGRCTGFLRSKVRTPGRVDLSSSKSANARLHRRMRQSANHGHAGLGIGPMPPHEERTTL